MEVFTEKNLTTERVKREIPLPGFNRSWATELLRVSAASGFTEKCFHTDVPNHKTPLRQRS